MQDGEDAWCRSKAVLDVSTTANDIGDSSIMVVVVVSSELLVVE